MPPPKNSGAPHSSVAICELAVADDGAPRRRQMRKRKRIGRRPRSDEEDCELMLEHLRKPVLQALGPVILPVGERLALVR